MEQNITKDFIDNFEKSHPKGVKIFYEWLEKYSQERSLYILFGVFDFFTMPIDIQIGIVNRFILEHTNKEIWYDERIYNEEYIREYMSLMFFVTEEGNHRDLLINENK